MNKPYLSSRQGPLRMRDESAVRTTRQSEMVPEAAPFEMALKVHTHQGYCLPNWRCSARSILSWVSASRTWRTFSPSKSSDATVIQKWERPEKTEMSRVACSQLVLKPRRLQTSLLLFEKWTFPLYTFASTLSNISIYQIFEGHRFLYSQRE